MGNNVVLKLKASEDIGLGHLSRMITPAAFLEEKSAKVVCAINNLEPIGKNKYLFDKDISENEHHLKNVISKSSFLVLGGAGSIGSATVKEIFERNPKKLHVVDLSENSFAEIVRDIRSFLDNIMINLKLK